MGVLATGIDARRRCVRASIRMTDALAGWVIQTDDPAVAMPPGDCPIGMDAPTWPFDPISTRLFAAPSLAGVDELCCQTTALMVPAAMITAATAASRELRRLTFR